MGWNGLDLINDFSAELGDVSNGFKTKVLRWINAGLRDIATSHAWPNLREKGKAILTDGLDTHSVVLEKADAPTVGALAGGALIDGTSYKALITFYEAQSGVESIAGTESSSIIPTGANLAIELTNIPVSACPLVTERRVYVQKGSGSFQYHGTIANNLAETAPAVPVTYDITADPSSMITPPDQNYIFQLDGDLFLEGEGRILRGTSVQDILQASGARALSGTPELWAPVNEEEVLTYPMPSSDLTASFYYFKLPAQVFGIVTSVPQMPSWIYDDLRRYVLWRGHDFRDRAGKESKEITYRENLKVTISRKGKPLKRSGRVRVVTPDSDGRVG